MVISKPLERSILRTAGTLWLCQLAFAGVTALAYGLSPFLTIFFLVLITVYHGLLAAAILGLRRLFVLESDGRLLDRVNVSNVLSAARLSALPTILFLILSSRETNLVPVILPYIVAIFLTDLIDGRLARRLGQITRIGRYLDAFSDYLVLTATLSAFLWFGLIPRWFFVLVLIRLTVVTVGNTAIHFLQGYVEPTSSFLGKASIFAIMTLFAAKILEIPYRRTFPQAGSVVWVLDRLEVMVAGVVLLAIVEKVGLMIMGVRAALARRHR